VREEEIKETEFKTRSQYKRPNQTGDLEPKAYGVWIKKVPKKTEGKKTKTPKQKTQKRNSPKKSFENRNKAFFVLRQTRSKALLPWLRLMQSKLSRNPRKPKRQRARETGR
jgi:DNA-directed RNA polymerase subunit M/transcription elongation factor TFIIS